jgi:uncharacterized protein involved in exopolysaccharide biosynthesis
MTAPVTPLTYGDVIQAIYARRKGIVVFVVASTLGAATLSLLLPSWYSAGAEFSVESAPTSTPQSSVLGLAAQLGFAGVPGATSINYYGDVINSNRVLDAAALDPLPVDSSGKNALVYTTSQSLTTLRARDKARLRLRQHLSVSVNGRTNTITFSIEGPSPIAARAAADTILSSLNRVIVELRRSRATAERQFLETRVDTAQVREGMLEDSLREFYLHNRLVNSPNLQFTEARLKRQLEFAQALTAQLRTQLEQARLQEVRDTPAISLVSAPEIPSRRSSPNRRLIVISAFVTASLIAITWIALAQALARQRESEKSLSGLPFPRAARS